MLLFHEKLKNKYGYFFLIIGMMTSFFDLLTYPVATFGIPIILFFILENKSLKEGIKDISELKETLKNIDTFTPNKLESNTENIVNIIRQFINEQ